MTKLGSLYIVATPIGNTQDITFRAIEILKNVTKIAAEDTRHSRPLLQHLGISTPLISLHDFNERECTEKLLGCLQRGESIALISDAGTPLISDPGYYLVREVRKQGIQVVPVPGACAAIAALSVAGLPTDKFSFHGFLPAKAGEREQCLAALAQEENTLVFYESPYRILDTLQAMTGVFGADRPAVVARELTKLYESIIDGTLAELLAKFTAEPETQRGEFVVIVAGKPKDTQTDILPPEALKVLTILLEELPVKQAAALAAKITGVRKNLLYDEALKLRA